MRFTTVLVFVAAAMIAAPVRAQDGVPPAPYAYRQLDDPAQEARAKALMATLRCLTCQSQSVADSDATMAGDVRNLVRQKIRAGEDPEAIRRWLIARYGDWISYDPPLDGATVALWLAPLLVLLLGVLLARGRFSPLRSGHDDTHERSSHRADA